ncbi:putative exonuclease [Armadillidium vulgare]|nr:putative exonuclease [Armadillidium vulgare]
MHVTTKSDFIQENGIISSLQENEAKDNDNQMDNPKLVLNLKGKETLLGRKAPQSPLWCSLLNRKLISNVTIVIVDGWDLYDLTSIMSYGNKSPNNKDLQDCASVMFNGDEPPKKKRRVSRKGNSVIEDVSHGVENLSTLERIERSLPNASTCFPLKFEVDSPSQISDDPIEELFSSIPMSVNVVETIKEKYKCLRDAVKFHVVSRVDSTVYSKSKCTLDVPKLEEESEKNFTSVEENLHNELSKVDLLLSIEEMFRFISFGRRRNDLREKFRLFHPHVIDTSLIYNLSHDVYRKPSLKLLAKLFLNKDIQNRGKDGHHPSEDAAASLELVLLKLKNGSYFGDVNKGGKLPCSPSEYLKTLKANRVKKYNNFDLSYIENYESTVPKIIRLEEGNNSLFVTNNSKTKSIFQSYGADWCHLVHQCKDSFKIEPEAHTSFKLVVRHCQVPSPVTSVKSEEKLQKLLNRIDKRLSRLHKSLPEKWFVVIRFKRSR